MKKPWILRLYGGFTRLIKNGLVKFMCYIGYRCENCKYCDPVCCFAGEISGKDFWCKNWKK